MGGFTNWRNRTEAASVCIGAIMYRLTAVSNRPHITSDAPTVGYSEPDSAAPD